MSVIQKNLKIPVEVYSRVVGYFRPLSNWHAGKQEEFKERKEYKFDNEMLLSRFIDKTKGDK